MRAFRFLGWILPLCWLWAAEPDGTTPLHWAARRDDAAAVEHLLKTGADANATNRYGVTSLSLACINGNARVIELLLEAGADPNKALPGGETPLMTASRTGRVEAIKALLAHGAKVNAKESRRGQTALMWAAAEGNTEAVNALLQAGADWKARLESGFTAFLFAVREGRGDIPPVDSRPVCRAESPEPFFSLL